LAEERARLGISQQKLADECQVTREQIGKYERDTNVPGGQVLAAFARLGLDTQYILTGVRSANLFQVAEQEAAPYNAGKTEGVGPLSRREEVLIAKYRQLSPGQQTHAQEVFDALASTLEKKDKTGDD